MWGIKGLAASRSSLSFFPGLLVVFTHPSRGRLSSEKGCKSRLLRDGEHVAGSEDVGAVADAGDGDEDSDVRLVVRPKSDHLQTTRM